MTRILLVEDEQSYREPLAYLLGREGFEVIEADTGPQALESAEEHEPDLILLDLMLPGLDGTEVCRRIRQTSNVPIIMLTAKDSEIDKVVGLEIGADDYVTKPYSARELLARVRAVLRRREKAAADDGAPEDSEEILRAGHVVMDVDRHTVTVNGDEVAFPLREFELLQFLLRNSGRVVTREQLIDRVWGADYVGDTKTLDVHVKRIRAKIETDPAAPKLLRTVRGVGYRLVD